MPKLLKDISPLFFSACDEPEPVCYTICTYRKTNSRSCISIVTILSKGWIVIPAEYRKEDKPSPGDEDRDTFVLLGYFQNEVGAARISEVLLERSPER